MPPFYPPVTTLPVEFSTQPLPSGILTLKNRTLRPVDRSLTLLVLSHNELVVVGSAHCDDQRDLYENSNHMSKANRRRVVERAHSSPALRMPSRKCGIAVGV